MKIAVYLGSEMGKNEIYREEVKKLGAWIGDNGHDLVYGGSAVGLMGVLADSVMEHGGEVYGVIPGFMVDRGLAKNNLTHDEVVADMSERKKRMLELGELYIAFPGGVGTMEEIFEAMSREKLHLSNRKCVFYNLDGYYDAMAAFFKRMVEDGFLKEADSYVFRTVSCVEELEQFVK